MDSCERLEELVRLGMLGIILQFPPPGKSILLIYLLSSSSYFGILEIRVREIVWDLKI